MSATSRDYVYQVIIGSARQKPEPTISLSTLRQYQKDIAKYLNNSNHDYSRSPVN